MFLRDIMVYENLTLLLGRILFGGYFLLSGVNHFTNAEGLIGWVESKGAPAPEALVYVSGLMLAAGGLGILTGVYPVVSAVLPAVFLIVVTPWFHNFWDMEGEEKQSHMTNFWKNIGLLGGLALFAHIALSTSMPYVLAALSLV